jgi:sulfite exporter TauE/SafE
VTPPMFDAVSLVAGTATLPLASVGSAIPAGTSSVELGVFLLIGVLGGAHCLGMCGPIVTMYADRLNAERDDRRDDVLTLYEVRQHGLFNAGRTISYAVLGGLFGLLGAVFFDAAETVTAVGQTVRAVTGLAVGLFVLVVGVRYLTGHHGSLLGNWAPLSGVYRRLSGHVDRVVDGHGIVGLGLLHGLLPCPLLYPAFLYAFARGDPLVGVLSLGVLGLGTFPTLFLYGTVVGAVSATQRQRLHRALGVAFLLLAWIPLSHGLMLFGIHVPHPPIPIYQPLEIVA